MITIKVAWGRENNEKLSELDEVKYKNWFKKHEKGYGIEQYQFNTQEELNAFILGVEQSNGWDEYNICKL